MRSASKSMRKWAHVFVSVSVAGVLSLTTAFVAPVSAASITWEQVGDVINGEAVGDQSGWSVSMSSDGSRMAIGSPFNDEGGGDSGRVRVYQLVDNAWVRLGGDIDGEAVWDRSGISVSLSSDGSRVAIGAPLNNGGGTGSGHVRVYQLSNGAWLKLGDDIDGEAAGDWSGWSVSLSGDGSRVGIGAPLNGGGGNASGHVRVYQLVDNAWVKLGDDIDGETAEDRSGYSVSLSGDGSRVAIGAQLNDGGGNNSGHVRVYQLVDNAWVKLGGDIDGQAAGDRSGNSVSLSADGSRVAIGAPLNDGGGDASGHVRVYQLVDNAWVKLGGDIDGETAEDRSGYSVSLSADGSRVAIGAPFNDGGGTDSGHARVYQLVDNAWVQLGDDIVGETAGDESGFSVSLSGDGSRVAIGAPFNDVGGDDAGRVRVFGVVQPVVTPAPEVPAVVTPAPVTANPTTVATAVVSAPASVSYRAANKGVTLRWRAVEGATSYVITTTNGTQVCAATTTSCVVNRLRNGRTYNYNVFAVNADGVRSTTGAQVSARPGFQVRSTTVKTKRSVSLSSIVTTPSKGRKTWMVTSGACRINGARLVTPTKKGSCKLRLSTAKSGAYGAMSTTINVSVR